MGAEFVVDLKQLAEKLGGGEFGSPKAERRRILRIGAPFVVVGEGPRL